MSNINKDNLINSNLNSIDSLCSSHSSNSDQKVQEARTGKIFPKIKKYAELKKTYMKAKTFSIPAKILIKILKLPPLAIVRFLDKHFLGFAVLFIILLTTFIIASFFTGGIPALSMIIAAFFVKGWGALGGAYLAAGFGKMGAFFASLGPAISKSFVVGKTVGLTTSAKGFGTVVASTGLTASGISWLIANSENESAKKLLRTEIGCEEFDAKSMETVIEHLLIYGSNKEVKKELIKDCKKEIEKAQEELADYKNLYQSHKQQLQQFKDIIERIGYFSDI